MKNNTQLNHLKKVESILSGIYLYAMRSGSTFESILEERNERVFKHPSYSKLTKQNKAYLSGVCSAFHAACYTHLKWLHTYDGRPIDKLDDVLGPDFDDKLLESNHYWFGDRTKPFNKENP